LLLGRSTNAPSIKQAKGAGWIQGEFDPNKSIHSVVKWIEKSARIWSCAALSPPAAVVAAVVSARWGRLVVFVVVASFGGSRGCSASRASHEAAAVSSAH
jgi:hypothetical protein